MSQLDRLVITAKPTVHVGPGAIGELPGIVRAVGADQAVVVTDEAFAVAPVIETVLTVLADAGVPARLFAGVHPVPTPADLAGGTDAVAEAAADAATMAAASASAAAVAAMLTPSAPLVTQPSGPHPVLRPSAPSQPSGPHPVLHAPAPSQPSGPHRVLRPSALPSPIPPALAGPRIVLVAVGSAAPIDAAKGIAIAAASSQSGQDPDARLDGALPIVAVPVAAGTGAETSCVGLIADPAD